MSLSVASGKYTHTRAAAITVPQLNHANLKNAGLGESVRWTLDSSPAFQRRVKWAARSRACSLIFRRTSRPNSLLASHRSESNLLQNILWPELKSASRHLHFALYLCGSEPIPHCQLHAFW
jgi:hypothetical protein